MASAPPSFLADRLAKAKQQAQGHRDAASARKPPPQQASQNASQHEALPYRQDSAPLPQPQPATIPTSPTNPPAKPRRRRAAPTAPGSSVNGSPEPNLTRRVAPAEILPNGKWDVAHRGADFVDAALVDRAFAAAAQGDRDLVEASRPHWPNVFAAIVIGAQIPGSRGNGDRQRLFRMLGMPATWLEGAGHAGDGRRGLGTTAAASSMALLASRVHRAQARIDGRRTSVTLTQSVTVDDADDGGFGEVAQLFDGQARYPTTDGEAS